jgi:hypothetical protein
MVGHLFLEMPRSGARGIAEMQMQPATADISRLLSMPASQRRNRVIDEVYRYEEFIMRQQIHHGELPRIQENHQH